jgi:hypothetical protein
MVYSWDQFDHIFNVNVYTFRRVHWPVNSEFYERVKYCNLTNGLPSKRVKMLNYEKDQTYLIPQLRGGGENRKRTEGTNPF